MEAASRGIASAFPSCSHVLDLAADTPRVHSTTPLSRLECMLQHCWRAAAWPQDRYNTPRVHAYVCISNTPRVHAYVCISDTPRVPGLRRWQRRSTRGGCPCLMTGSIPLAPTTSPRCLVVCAVLLSCVVRDSPRCLVACAVLLSRVVSGCPHTTPHTPPPHPTPYTLHPKSHTRAHR